ncbi:hypothetical protein AMELA_G00101000 [Ameiurus melas]|uniref:Uncharacterized protein n=1 Tax=Ameiurus melas TaxID=219545 RepID=A0A7J6AUW3_AMEME|nr:hypothetical protein AMELA_G00101000 [Ameiurus melas]
MKVLCRHLGSFRILTPISSGWSENTFKHGRKKRKESGTLFSSEIKSPGVPSLVPDASWDRLQVPRDPEKE